MSRENSAVVLASRRRAEFRCVRLGVEQVVEDALDLRLIVVYLDIRVCPCYIQSALFGV